MGGRRQPFVRDLMLFRLDKRKRYLNGQNLMATEVEMSHPSFSPAASHSGSNNGHHDHHEVNIEAIGEDVKACNNAMTTLVQIFSIPGQDSNSTMKDATDKLKELLVAIRSVVTKYQANFDPKATQGMGFTTIPIARATLNVRFMTYK